MATADRLAWRTSTYTDNGASCVEVAPGPGAVLVRDTKDGGTGPILMFDHSGWAKFCAAAHAGHTGPVAGVTITHIDGRTWQVAGPGRSLHFTEAEWAAFASGVRDGEFDFAPA